MSSGDLVDRSPATWGETMKHEGHALMAWLSWAALKFDGATTIADYLVQRVSRWYICPDSCEAVEAFLVVEESTYHKLRDSYIMPDYGDSVPEVYDPKTKSYGIPLLGMDLIRLACVEADEGRLFDMNCQLLGPWLGEDAEEIRKADKSGGSHQAYPFDHTSESKDKPDLNMFDVATFFGKRFFDTLSLSNGGQDLRWRQLYLLGRLLHLVQDAYTLHHALVDVHDANCWWIFCSGTDSGHKAHESEMLKLQKAVCKADDFGFSDQAAADKNQAECLAAIGTEMESREFGVYEVHPEHFFRPKNAKPYDWLSVDPSVDQNGCHQHIHTSDTKFHHSWIDYNLHSVIRFAGADGLWTHIGGHDNVVNTDSGNGILSVKGATPGDEMLLDFWGRMDVNAVGMNETDCAYAQEAILSPDEGEQQGARLLITAKSSGAYEIVDGGFKLGKPLPSLYCTIQVGDDPEYVFKTSRVIALNMAVSTGAGFLCCAAGLMGASAERGYELSGVKAVKGVVRSFATKGGGKKKVQGYLGDLNKHTALPLGVLIPSEPFIGFGFKVPWEMEMSALPPNNLMDAIVMHSRPGKWVGAVFSKVPDWSRVGFDRYFVAGVKLYSASSFPLDNAKTAYIARVCYWEEEGNTWIVLGRLRLDSTEERLITIPLCRFDVEEKKFPSKWRLDAERLHASAGEDGTSAERELWHLAWVWPMVALLPGKAQSTD